MLWCKLNLRGFRFSVIRGIFMIGLWVVLTGILRFNNGNDPLGVLLITRSILAIIGGVVGADLHLNFGLRGDEQGIHKLSVWMTGYIGLIILVMEIVIQGLETGLPVGLWMAFLFYIVYFTGMSLFGSKTSQ